VIRVLDAREMRIDSEDDVALVRRYVRERAIARGFDPFATAAVTTATSELSRNVWVHARRGFAVIEEVTDGQRLGLHVRFVDDGPGIADLPRALAGGYSTMRSMGLGLSGSKKLVDEFDIDTAAGRGTKVTIVKWARLS
jgi:serine/threonine-protein kinase RsbT